MSPDASWIHQQWELVQGLIGGQTAAGYYNSDRVVAAEEAGRVSVADAVLGRVLATEPVTERKETVLRAAEVMAQHLRFREVANQCHNLSLELFMMLDHLDIPSAPIWGTVWAGRRDGTREFVLTPFVPQEAAVHRPGHSWIITPELAVVDVALRHQAWVEGNYEELQDSIPSVVISERQIVNAKPDRRWLTQPGAPLLPDQLYYGDALKYFPALGWTEVTIGDLVLRYIPSAVGLPEVGDDLHRALPLIGGETPHRFFNRRLRRALRDSQGGAPH